VAREAAVGRLVLTHLAADDRASSLAAAQTIFANTDLALPGAVFDI
ncbi:MAG: hypothetical protein QOH74_43, partial [Gaiellales bacterium]|nr:hypothetical protein [Gaiellales bacterium]